MEKALKLLERTPASPLSVKSQRCRTVLRVWLALARKNQAKSEATNSLQARPLGFTGRKTKPNGDHLKLNDE
jgi:hypothetical protein